jgi:GNAT superfamily N-acetyltransferase
VTDGHLTNVNVAAATEADRAELDAILAASWGEPRAVGHGVSYDLRVLPTLVARDGSRIVGVLTYVMRHGALAVVSIDAVEPYRGVGGALLRRAADIARDAGLSRPWLVTTNDNLDALRFYQRRGMRITAVTPGAVRTSRRLKPAIPEIGRYGIPIRDEIVLEMPIP